MSPFLWCPFCCGGDIRCNAVNEGLYSAFCPDCGANGPQADTEKEATELWNKRWIDESGKSTEISPSELKENKMETQSKKKPSFQWELNDEGMPTRLLDEQGDCLLYVSLGDGGPYIQPDVPDIFVRIARLPFLEQTHEDQIKKEQIEVPGPNDPDSLLKDCQVAIEILAHRTVLSEELDASLADVLHCLYKITKVLQILLVAQRENVRNINRIFELFPPDVRY